MSFSYILNEHQKKNTHTIQIGTQCCCDTFDEQIASFSIQTKDYELNQINAPTHFTHKKQNYFEWNQNWAWVSYLCKQPLNGLFCSCLLGNILLFLLLIATEELYASNFDIPILICDNSFIEMRTFNFNNFLLHQQLKIASKNWKMFLFMKKNILNRQITFS